MLLAVNFLDRLLGKVSHHARNVLTYGFLLEFLLLLHAVLAVIATVLVVLTMTTVLLLAALAALVLAAKSLGATIASIKGVLHRVAGKATRAACKGTATIVVAAIAVTVVVTAIAVAVVAIVRKATKSSCITLLVTVVVTVTAAVRLSLLLRLLDTGKNGFVRFEHLSLHRRLLEFHARGNHGRLCCGRCCCGSRSGCRSGRLNSRSYGLDCCRGGRCSRCRSMCCGSRLHFCLRSCGLFSRSGFNLRGCRRCGRSGRLHFRGLRCFDSGRGLGLGGGGSCGRFHRSSRLCGGRCGSSGSGLCSCRLLRSNQLGLQLAIASRSRLTLLVRRSIGSFGGRCLFQILVAGFGLLAFRLGICFDLLVVLSVKLRHLSTDSNARITKQLHHDINLDAVFLCPIYWFNLFFISHE